MDTTFSIEFLTSLFNEMKETGTNYVTLDKMIKEFDVYQRESKNKIFTKNKNTMKKNINLHYLKIFTNKLINQLNRFQ